MTENKTKIYYGWWILLICFILMFLGDTAHGPLFRYIISTRDVYDWRNFGWYWGISGLLGFFGGLVVAPFIDRFGPRRFLLIGFLLLGIGFVILSFVNAVWMSFVVSILVGLGFGIALQVAPHTAIVHWFKKRRCFALSLLLAGSVLGRRLIDEPAIEDFISSSNSNWTALGIGLAILVICVPLTLMIRNRLGNHTRSAEDKIGDNPDELDSDDAVPDSTDFSVREVLKSKPFWLLTIAMALAGAAKMLVGNFDIIFLRQETDISWFVFVDIDRLAPFFSLVGILLFGYIGDKYSKRYLLVIAVAIQGVSVVILMTVGSIAQLYIYYIVLGISSGTIPLLFAIRADYFGLKRFATIAAIMIVFSSIIGIAPSAGFVFLSNRIYDEGGNVQINFIISIVVSLIAMTMYFFARPPKARETT